MKPWFFLHQGFLAYHTQDIEGNHGQFKDQGVRVEFPGREALQIHIGFEFAMVLSAPPSHKKRQGFS